MSKAQDKLGLARGTLYKIEFGIELDKDEVAKTLAATANDEEQEVHPGHALLRERIPNTHRRRQLVIALCEHGVKDTLFRRGVGVLFNDEEVALIESFIESI